MESLLPFLQGTCTPYNMPVYPGAQCINRQFTHRGRISTDISASGKGSRVRHMVPGGSRATRTLPHSMLCCPNPDGVA